MSDIKVSVCVPVYGVEKYIERCVRSLWEQTMQDGIEFIIVNDCTKDRSMEILKEILKEYPNRESQVKIVDHEKNMGLTGARNTALKYAVGEYITHCDSDDWVDPDYYEKMYHTASAANADVVYTEFLFEKDDKQTLYSIAPYTDVERFFKENFNTLAFNSLVNKMIRKEIALAEDINVPAHINVAEDLLRSGQMMLFCKSLVFCPGTYYHYFRSNSESISCKIGRKNLTDNYEIGETFCQRFPEKYRPICEAFRGQVLFTGLRVRDLSRQEYRALYPDYKQLIWSVVRNGYLPLKKRAFLFGAHFAYYFFKWVLKCVARDKVAV